MIHQTAKKGPVKKVSLALRGEKARQMYNEGYSLRQIGDHLGVSATTILYHMKHVRMVDRVTALEQKIEKIEYMLSKLSVTDNE